jgi:hypothetical protein
MTTGTREETQHFAVRTVITGHCGELLTPAKVDQILTELEAEMRAGPCSWAFGKGDEE